jgi:hypothetical protein
MTILNDPQTAPEPALVYQIRLKGHLGPQGMDWFDGLTVALEECGETVLTCPVMDQAGLHGVLKKIRDLGMPLLAVNLVIAGQPDSASIKQPKEIHK